jgi:choline dehydrogenase
MLLSADYPEAGPPTRQGITPTSYINSPASLGEVRLASADPLDRPIIDPRYLSESEDVRWTVAGIQWNLRILYAMAFADIRGEEVTPGLFTRNDADLEAFARRSASTTSHSAGTCAMGQDDRAVIDPRLLVHGLSGLRVVEASIMPTIVRVNTNAPVIMIAERAADWIHRSSP